MFIATQHRIPDQFGSSSTARRHEAERNATRRQRDPANGDMRQGKSRCAAMVVVAVASLAAGGCSTIVDLAGVPRAGMQSDGRYVLSDSEIALECRGLADGIDSELMLMAQTGSRLAKERQAPAKTLAGLLGRSFGGPDGGLTNARLLAESEARVRALSAEQRRRNCPGDASQSIEARIAESRDPLAPAPQLPDKETQVEHAAPGEDVAVPHRL